MRPRENAGVFFSPGMDTLERVYIDPRDEGRILQHFRLPFFDCQKFDGQKTGNGRKTGHTR